MTDTNGTRARLVAAAEHLFAERGIDAVSLREITRMSGARNAVATQYHLGDREGVLAAILSKHEPAVDARRNALLDDYEARGVPDPRALAAALVRPLAAELADGDGGREFLQIYAEVLDRTPPGGPRSSPGSSLERWRALVEPVLEPDAVRLHRRYTALLHAAVELRRRARGRAHGDDRLFISYLVDVVTAILTAPVSEETRRLASERDAALERRRHARRRDVAGPTRRR